MDISILSLQDDIDDALVLLLLVLVAVDAPMSDSPILLLLLLEVDDDIFRVESVVVGGDVREKELSTVNEENEDDCDGKADR